MRARGVVTGLVACGVSAFSSLALSGCGGPDGSGANSAGGVSGSSGTGTGSGGSIGTGGLGGVSTASGGAGTGAAAECSCPAGGDPYGVLVHSASEDSELFVNAETPASASLACDDWLSGPLRGQLRSTCGGTRITFAACQGAGTSPPCLLVDGSAVTYVDSLGLEWRGTASQPKPAMPPTLVDPQRQEGSFTVQVTREGASQDLSVSYVLCGADSRVLVPC